MDNNKRALVLTGDLLPGFDAQAVWVAVARYFKIDEARLTTDVLARVPMTVKESSDLADLTVRQSKLTELGAVSEVHSLDGGSHFVLIDSVPRGPLPRAYIENRLRNGGWPASIKIAPVGSTDWRTFNPGEEITAPPPPLPSGPSATVDPEDTVAAKIARVADSIASKKESLRPLPAGPAIHAGFWRRCAAYLIDYLVLLVPGVIVMLIPILGAFIYLGGRWAYFALMESSASQATLGKRVMGIKATDGKGQRLSIGQASGRYFAGAISYITFGIGYAMAGWTSRKQALQDLIADTCVVFDTVEPGEPLPTVRPPMPWYGWAANFLLLAVFPVSIIAAIALPAYQDYVVRAKVSNAMIEADVAKISVVEAVMADGTCQAQIPESSNPLVASIRVSGTAPNCVITLMFASGSDTPSMIRDQAIELQSSKSPDTEFLVWSCSSVITPEYLPSSCRP